MITRQGNWLGQQRIDVPHIRAMESSVAADFDVLAGRMLAGKQALVLKGMNLVTTGAIGAQASALQVQVADAAIMHFGASEAGTVFWVPDTVAAETLTSTNPKVTGSFTASQTNYIGLDLLRAADDTTSDNVQFLEGTTLKEVPKTVPLARTLSYRFIVSTSDFSSQPNVLPIAKVVTDANNNVSSIEDARQMFFRLGSGGDFPDRKAAYTWPGSRYENTSGDVFAGGDKSIGDFKTWMNAIMTRLWEVGGGEYWYSATADRNVTLIWTGATFTNGENFEWVASNLHWKGLKVIFDNSTSYFNDVKDQTVNSAGLTDLADGDCIYVDLDRTQNLTGGTALQPVKAPLITLGSPTVPGSRYIVAWRIGANIYTRNWRYAVGTTFTPATTTALGVVALNNTPGSAGTPKVVSIMNNGQAEVAATGGNSHGFKGTGNGTGPGVWGVGGATGPGGNFQGGAGIAVTCNNQRIDSVADPTANADAATKQYVDRVRSTMQFTNWTKRTSGTANHLYGVCAAVGGIGGIMHVAVGATSTILTSDDKGATWTARTDPVGATDNNAVAYSGTLYTIVGNAGKILTSPDGITWTSRVSGTAGDLFGVAWSAALGLWCAVGQVSAGAAVILTSPDGITWTSRVPPTHPGLGSTTYNLGGVIFANGIFLAQIGRVGSTYGVVRSADGITWTIPLVDGVGTAAGSADFGRQSLIYAHSKFILFGTTSAAGTGSKVWTSPDGNTWTTVATVAEGILAATAMFNNGVGTVIVVPGDNYAPNKSRILYTWDGVTFTEKRLVGLEQAPKDAAYTADHAIVVGLNGSIYASLVGF